MKIFLIRVMMRLFSWITPPVAEVIAPPFAWVLWYVSPKRRHVTRKNLQAAYPQWDAQQLNKVARESMVHYVRGIFEVGMLWHWPLERIFSYFDESEDLNRFLESFQSDTGAILAGGHTGAWELLGMFIQQYMNGAILYKPGRQADVEKLLLEKRRQGGARLVPVSGSGLRTVFKLLKSGTTVAMMADQEPTLGQGQFAPFYGVETLTGVIVPRLAQRTSAPVIFGTCERRKGGRYKVHVFMADEEIYSRDMRKALSALNRGIEKCIEVNTAQNLWAYKRFRNRPEGSASFYKKDV